MFLGSLEDVGRDGQHAEYVSVKALSYWGRDVYLIVTLDIRSVH